MLNSGHEENVIEPSCEEILFQSLWLLSEWKSSAMLSWTFVVMACKLLLNSCMYVEEAVEDSSWSVVLHLGGWMGGYQPLTIKI